MTPLTDPPENPLGGKTLVVDAARQGDYAKPSAALKDAGPEDQVYLRPGIYEDQITVMDRPVRLIGAGRDHVQIVSRRGGPLALQEVPGGLITGITFRYLGSDQHSAMHLLDSTCLITACRLTEGILSGIVIFGPEARPTFTENEVSFNRESGVFIFAGARPYVAQNLCHGNYHFGIAVRDRDSRPDLVRNTCRKNLLSGILLFHHAQALLVENHCYDNEGWGFVMTPDSKPSPPSDELASANTLDHNPRGAVHVTEEPLTEIGR